MSTVRGVKATQRKSDYAPGSVLNAATGVPVLQANQPPMNGNVPQMQPTIAFTIPSVDPSTNPMAQNSFRSVPARNLSNPTIQYGAGEVTLEQQVPGSYTIQPRGLSQTGQGQAYPPGSQLQGYSAPPNYSTQMFNPNQYNQSLYQVSPPFYPVVTSQVYPTNPVYYQPQQAQPQYLQQARVVFQQAPVQAPVPPAAPSRPKKVLQIVDPATKEVTNQREVSASKQYPDDELQNVAAESSQQGGRRSVLSITEPPPSGADVLPQQTVSQTLLRQVTLSVMGEAAAPPSSAPPPSVLEEPPSLQLPPSSSAPPLEQVETVAATEDEAPIVYEKSPPQTDMITEEKSSPEDEAKMGNSGLSADTAASATNATDLGVDIAGVVSDAVATKKDVEKAPTDFGDAEKENLKPKEDVAPVSDSAALLAESDATVMGVDQPDKAIPGNHAVDVVIEETENEEKAAVETEKASEAVEVKESEAATKERKLTEFNAKRREMLAAKELVDLEGKVYGRSYMYLMREIIKEFCLTSACPVPIGELKNHGIDMGSAPATSSSSLGSGRRYDYGAKGGSNFTPNWVESGKSQKPKPYYGRSSDRTGHGGGGRDRERKRSAVARPSIDRPPREPVKLHKAANAWKPDIGKKENDMEKFYKAIRGLLNKITPSTFSSLCEEFLAYQCYKNKEKMNEVINIIFDKAVEEPKFCPLYSDLCKKQVMDELNAGNVSEFRSGILTRCQQTFENKRQDEINKKKEEAEEEQDERKKKELKLEVMEMVAKERRRMFGNIGFIGQLYRHELIVPKILKWCIIHLLKNHSEAPEGDEESIECAVRMLETVGKIADSQPSGEFDLNMYFQHLKDLINTVSNRIRFLILNLIELRESRWNPRKSADSGPKTIEEVHKEAQKEEMQAKIAREQYDKGRKPYDGRPSMERQRKTIIGRPSQDNRYGRGEQSRDQKTRAAGQAAQNAGTATRKNQSLAQMDQAGKLAPRKGQFHQGSSGGGGEDRKSSANVPIGMRGAGRGIATSRDNSEPSSREHSESRKHSTLDYERQRVLAAVQSMTHSGSRPSMTPSASASSLKAAGEGVRSGTHSDDDERLKPEGLSEEEERRLLSSLNSDLQEFFQGPTNEDRVSELRQAFQEAIAKSSVSMAFRLLFQVGVEKIGCKEGEKNYRQYLGQALCLCLQDVVDRKEEAMQGVANFCSFAVEISLWEDVPSLWQWVAEIICWSIMCDTKDVGGARPSLLDFKASFIAADEDTRKKHALLVCVLKRLAEIEQNREGGTQATAMVFEELKSLHSDSLMEALQSTELSTGGNLLHKLLNN